MGEDLVRLAKSGDRSAFEKLVTQHQKMVYNIAYRMTGSPEDAMDMAQEAFFKAWKGLGSFKEESSFSTWLYRITVHTCGDWLRKNGSKAEKSVSLNAVGQDGEELTVDVADTRFSPETELERRELARAVGKALEEMPADYRRVLSMRENAGMSYEQIGSVLELKPGTVKSRIFRAREYLRKKLTQSGNISADSSSNQSVGG